MPTQVAARRKATQLVVSAVESNAKSIQDGVTAILKAYLKPGEKMPAIDLLAELIARQLSDKSSALAAASQEKETQAGAASSPLRERDHARDAVYEVVGGVRHTIEAVYGPAGLALFLFKGHTPVEPEALLETAQRARDILAGAGTKWPEPIVPGVTIDAQAWVKKLDAVVPALAADVKAAEQGKRGVGGATAGKHAAMADNDHAFVRGAQAVEALLRLAGQDELAEQVRPSHHRAGLTTAQAGSATPAAAK